MLRSVSAQLRTWAQSYSTRAATADATTTVLRRQDAWYVRLVVPVVVLQGVGLTYACLTLPVARKGEETSPVRRAFYATCSIFLSIGALSAARKLTRGRLMSLRIDNARQAAQLLSRHWYDPTGAQFVAATAKVAPRAQSQLSVSFAQLDRAAQDRAVARATRTRSKNKFSGLLAIRVYAGVPGREGSYETYTVDARDCDVFNVDALRGIAVNVDVDAKGQPIDRALR